MKWKTRIKNQLLRSRRKLFEAFGSARYSQPAEKALDKKLEKYLDYQDGFFIEVGAYNGYNISNTYYLESMKKWKGILIEPIPELYKQCLIERPKSRVFNCALVSREFTGSSLTLEYFRARSFSEGAWVESDLELIQKRKKDEDRIKPYKVSVPARTLDSILEECHVSTIDFFSLDVEGYELEVLNGLNLRKWQPKYILIEALNIREHEAHRDHISELYEEVEQLSPVDFLYKWRGATGSLEV